MKISTSLSYCSWSSLLRAGFLFSILINPEDEVICCYEMSVDFQWTPWHYIPVDITHLTQLCVWKDLFRCTGFDSRHYQIFWEVVGLELGPLSLVSTIEQLLGRRSSSSFGLENLEYGLRDPLCRPRIMLYLQQLALTSPAVGGRSVGIVCSRTEATEFVCLFVWWLLQRNTFCFEY
jgi:hypothetical protein